MAVARSRLRLPAALAALLLVLVGAGEGVGISFCLHEASGHGAGHSEPGHPLPDRDPAPGEEHGAEHPASGEHARQFHGHAPHEHGNAPHEHGHAPHGHGHAPHGHGHGADVHTSHEPERHDPSDPCGALCQFLCVLAAGTHLPGPDSGVASAAYSPQVEFSPSPPAPPEVPRPTSLPHVLPFAQAPPVFG
jgi:hypothetical protein